jgi:hypothetical protein
MGCSSPPGESLVPNCLSGGKLTFERAYYNRQTAAAELAVLT